MGYAVSEKTISPLSKQGEIALALLCAGCCKLRTNHVVNFPQACLVIISKLYAMSRSTDYVIYNQEKDLYDKEIIFASVA